MSSLLVRNVNHLVTCDANDRLYSNINVLGGRWRYYTHSK